MADATIHGMTLNSPERPSRVFGKGRRCREPGCGTQLSIYNSGKYCYLHEPAATPRTRGKKIA
jgi:hypothetical protein